jgi:hypothetical protein
MGKAMTQIEALIISVSARKTLACQLQGAALSAPDCGLAYSQKPFT